MLQAIATGSVSKIAVQTCCDREANMNQRQLIGSQTFDRIIEKFGILCGLILERRCT